MTKKEIGRTIGHTLKSLMKLGHAPQLHRWHTCVVPKGLRIFLQTPINPMYENIQLGRLKDNIYMICTNKCI